MGDSISDLIEKISSLENDLGRALSERADELKRDLELRRVEFEDELLRRHRELRIGLSDYLKNASVLSFLTAPVIYSLIIPLAIFDVFLFLYQSVCFPVYRIGKVRRSDYLIFDRAHLAYLNPIEKLNCAFCSYANGLIAYAREIAGRTEAHWCPIKHARNYLGSHRYYQKFYDYGDAESYRKTNVNS